MAEIVDGEDRISELPIHIIHDILGRIRLHEEKARTCVLSKTWNSIWRTLPEVTASYFHRSFYKKMEDFVKFIDYSLCPYVEHNLRIKRLHLSCLHPPELAPHIDRWIKLAIICNVKALEIYASSFGSEYYSIPDSIYASNKTMLSVLYLAGCNFGIDNSTTNKLQGLIRTNPLIRDLKLSDCIGLQSCHVSGLVNLEKLELSLCKGLINVEIRAPNLRQFVFVGVSLDKYPKTREPKSLPCTIDILDGYNTLKYLHLEATTMTDQQLEYQLSKFPALEFLELTECYVMEKIKVISKKLKRFRLSHWGNLKQVNILAPNLKEFDFVGYKMPFSISTVDPSKLEQAELSFYLQPSDTYNFGNVDTSWYNNLQDFVQKFTYSKGQILTIHCPKDKSILIYEDPSEILVPPAQHLNLCIKNCSMRLDSFVHDQITLGCPKIISIVSCTDDSKLLQIFHETTIACKRKQMRGLKEVTNHKGSSKVENDSDMYTWLKSKSLIERITTFNFVWEED